MKGQCVRQAQVKSSDILSCFKKLPRLLLIDDDELFSAILYRLAKLGKISLDYVSSPKKVDFFNLRSRYDVIIVDYDLGSISGIQIIKALEATNQVLPTILISSYGHIKSSELPNSVFLSLHKCDGPQRILYAALCAYNKISDKL